MKFFAAVVGILGLLILPARAWNNVGHRTVAELAWRQLTPTQRQAASELLRQHPHYKEFLAADISKGAGKDEWVFLTAAVWPDWVRPAKKGQPHKPESVTKYDLYPHAIGYPFLGPGETDRELLEKFHISKPNAEMVLSNCVATLRNPKASAHDRAVSLCWVLHLYGDLHQPLHAASRVSRAHPHGEGLGGGDIVLNGQGNETDLHSFWDRLPGVDPEYSTIKSLADSLQSDAELKPEKLAELREHTSIPAWVQDSYHLAVNFAYAPNHVRYVREETLKEKKTPDVVIPKVSDEYVAGAHKIARRQLVLASQRLLIVLRQVWQN